MAGVFEAGTGLTRLLFEPRVRTGKFTKAIVSSGVDESTYFDL
jgi:hypothetical protein